MLVAGISPVNNRNTLCTVGPGIGVAVTAPGIEILHGYRGVFIICPGNVFSKNLNKYRKKVKIGDRLPPKI
jgi:hypothetical protein